MAYKKKMNMLQFGLLTSWIVYFLVRQVVSTPTKSHRIHQLDNTQSPINRSGCNDKTNTENTTIIDIENISVMISNDGNVTIINSDDSDSDIEEFRESSSGDMY